MVREIKHPTVAAIALDQSRAAIFLLQSPSLDLGLREGKDMRSAIIALSTASALLISGSIKADTLFTSSQWEVSEETLLGREACTLTYRGNRFVLIALAVDDNYALNFYSPNWKFRKRTAAAVLGSGDVQFMGSGVYVADKMIVDPHSNYEDDSIYLEVGWQPIPKELMDMSKSGQPLSLMDDKGKTLLKWSLKGAQKPLKAWSDCADRL